MRESKGKRRQATAMAEIEEEEDSPVAQDESHPKTNGGRTVYIYMLDLENQAHRDENDDWVWHVPAGRQVAVLYIQGIAEVISKAGWRVPEGRTVCEVFGGLENPLPREDGVVDPNDPPTDWLRLTTDEEVDGFLRLMGAKPIRLLVCLHRDPRAVPRVPDTPPPEEDPHPGKFYFSADMFDKDKWEQDLVEDSDAESRKRAGLGARHVPKADHRFEDRIEEVWRRIRRQQAMLDDLERKHKAKYPAAIHETDAGGHLRQSIYGDNDSLTGHEVILFRAVVRKWKRKYASLKAHNDQLDEAQYEEDATTYVITKFLAGSFGALPAP